MRTRAAAPEEDGISPAMLKSGQLNSIIGHHEDTDCPECGFPLDEGDRAFLCDRSELYFCSKYCSMLYNQRPQPEPIIIGEAFKEGGR